MKVSYLMYVKTKEDNFDLYVKIAWSKENFHIFRTVDTTVNVETSSLWPEKAPKEFNTSFKFWFTVTEEKYHFDHFLKILNKSI